MGERWGLCWGGQWGLWVFIKRTGKEVYGLLKWVQDVLLDDQSNRAFGCSVGKREKVVARLF